MKAFGRPVVECIRPYARNKIAELMDKLVRQDRVEFNDEVARVLPGKVILSLLRFPDDLYPRLRQWSIDVMMGLGMPRPEPEWVAAADRAFFEMSECCQVQIDDRRKNPREDDFITALTEAKEGNDALSDEEIIAVLQLSLVAGHDTTTNSMTLGVAALARDSQSWLHMREHPEQALDCVLEIMRYTAMSAAQRRVASADFDWHGRQIKKGDLVMLILASGNRDPRVYSDPERLDLTRKNDESLTFAPGLHHCIGHLLAKMQLTEFFTALTERFDGAEIVDPEIRYSPILIFRTIPTLNIRFHPRASLGD